MNQRTDSNRTLARLRTLLTDGTYHLHSRLPPERNLAEELHVSRSTLRKALDVLEAEGLVRRHVGRGTFVGGMPPTRDLSLLPARAGLAPRELFDASMVLEPAIAARAAATARSSDLDLIKQCLAKRAVATDQDAYELWDFALHRSIAEATHNPLLVLILDALNNLRQQPEWRSYRASTLERQNRDASAREHQDIIDAIENRDPQAAFESMRRHINAFQEPPLRQ